ncbi:polysaccharide pyruvyl transferase family protein [Pseudorhodobacter sp. W20_MBD10_FR17]|uniref:polysaccharide pyruvyl transferase family protein n=1 Tax=Pseudorhodobacter sp. W20_MBD10_FR17 TaxID=3240266 RepID=UPI003F95F475
MNAIKSVYTLTFHDVPNIGAILQAYALQRFLIQAGYSSKILDYRPLYHYVDLLKPYKGLSRNINKFRMHRNIRAFSKKYLHLSESRLKNVNDFARFNSSSALVVGSDQIWNPTLTGYGVDKTFLLAGKTDARKIAYAASAGGKILSGSVAKDQLRDFHAVSVREDHLRQDLVKNGLYPDAITVLDPTFLLQSYTDLVADEPPITEKYVASYEVSSSISRANFAIEAGKLKQKCALPLYHLGSNPIDSADVSLIPPTPNKWLRTLLDAEYVIANSFHGLAFSIILRKKFVYLLHREAEKNARALTLLKTAGLEARAVLSVDDISIDQIDADIDYGRIDEAANMSRQFLLSALC